QERHTIQSYLTLLAIPPSSIKTVLFLALARRLTFFTIVIGNVKSQIIFLPETSGKISLKLRKS
ncbi:hypothetical protein, partial [Vibrio alfacsensis]|uniref:hypothetical protein n=1 Tax=Vibrio alfacsensis TaxID=1074311 RepID=UPI0040690F0B